MSCSGDMESNGGRDEGPPGHAYGPLREQNTPSHWEPRDFLEETGSSLVLGCGQQDPGLSPPPALALGPRADTLTAPQFLETCRSGVTTGTLQPANYCFSPGPCKSPPCEGASSSDLGLQ